MLNYLEYTIFDGKGTEVENIREVAYLSETTITTAQTVYDAIVNILGYIPQIGEYYPILGIRVDRIGADE